MTTLRREWPALALLVAAPLLFHWPLLAPGAGRHYLVPGDFVDQFYAFASFAVREIASGRLPLWNPHAYGGAPFWADIQAAVAYPPNLAMTLVAAKLWGRLPFALLEIQALGHLALAGVWTYLFARRHLGSGAFVAALCFQLGGYLTGYPPLQLAILATVTWLPLALIGVDWIVAAARVSAGANPSAPVNATLGSRVRQAHSCRGCLLLGTAWGLNLLAGHPQSAMQCLYLSLAYAGWRLWPLRGAGISLLRQAGISVAAAMAMALGLSAAGWLPAAEFWQLSNRAAASYEQLANGFPARELLGLLLAGLTQWSPLYVGVLPLLLAVAGGWWALGAPQLGAAVHHGAASNPDGSGTEAARFTRFWLVVLVVGLFLSLGRHSFVFDLAYRLVPGFNLFRGQERAALWVSLALAMLAGGGSRLWARRRMAEAVGRVLSLGAMAIAALAVLLLVVAAADYRAAALRLLLAAGGAAVVAAAGRSGSQARAISSALVAVVIFVDLYSAGGRTNLSPAAPGELAVSPIVAALRTSAQRVQNDDALPPNFGVLHGVDAVSGASPLRLGTFERLRDSLAEHPALLRQLLAVTDRVTTAADPGPGAVNVMATGDGTGKVYLHRFELASPYAWPVHRAEWAKDEAAALARMKAADFNPSSLVVLIGAAPADGSAAAPGGAAAPGSEGIPARGEGGERGVIGESGVSGVSADFQASEVTVVSRRAGEVVAMMRSEAPGWLVFSEMAYPGWRATVDGVPSLVERADGALMAVAVPAGGHTVALVYDGLLVRVGLAISMISALVMMIACVRLLQEPLLTARRSMS